jgi:hypothetical protein
MIEWDINYVCWRPGGAALKLKFFDARVRAPSYEFAGAAAAAGQA